MGKPVSYVTPPPNTLQMDPSHLAIQFASRPPALSNWPPAYTSAPDMAMAYTVADIPSVIMVIPSPSALHSDPSHLAILFAGDMPAVSKLPPAYISPVPEIAIADTLPALPSKVTPFPSALQVSPTVSHLAMPFAKSPPAL